MAARGETGTRRWSRRRTAVVATTALVAAFAVEGPALAATTGTGSANVTFAAGALSVTNVAGTSSLTGTIGGSASGVLPAVTMQDTTASGAGWKALVAVSTPVYTGTWTTVTGTALSNTSSGAYTGTNDGMTYTVTVTGLGIVLGGGSVSWTNQDGSESGTATVSGGNATITKGITISFGAGSTAVTGSQYSIKVGALPTNAVHLSTGAAGAQVTTTSGNTAPVLVNDGVTVTAGGAGVYGTQVQFASAATNTGMGTYVLTPGVNVAAGSWAATYNIGVQYTIATGP